jgi:hypothetical protein
MEQYLKETKLLDYSHPNIQNLVIKQGWLNMKPADKVSHIYNYVRDEIRFGYNKADDIPASRVLQDGYGQCNTKATLLMALLRAVGIPNRIHGFTINKELQKGAITGIWYKRAPENILHSWVEVYVNTNWFYLEGVILDIKYLQALQKEFNTCNQNFCGYGVYTENFQNPDIEWNLNNTFIQKEGINKDFGLFDTPDELYNKHQQKLSPLLQFVYKYYLRHLMNKNIKRIRDAC